MQHLQRSTAQPMSLGVVYKLWICKSTSQLSFALLFGSIREVSDKRTILNFRSNSRRGTCNFQGGASYAYDGANVEIHDTIFDSNSADYVSSSDPVSKNFPEFSLQFRRGTWNSKGGAIFAHGADVKIYTSIFESNSAGCVSSAKSGFRNFLNFLRSNSRRATYN
jgi:hypothetical protein